MTHWVSWLHRYYCFQQGRARRAYRKRSGQHIAAPFAPRYHQHQQSSGQPIHIVTVLLAAA